MIPATALELPGPAGGERGRRRRGAGGLLGLKICLADGVALVNVVRRPAQVELLRSLGAKHVCSSSGPGFREDLVAALAEALRPEAIEVYRRQATGEKYLIRPNRVA